jgi:hypothetical protein
MQAFIAEDGISKEILNSAKLLQAVQVNALIPSSAIKSCIITTSFFNRYFID